MNNDTNTKPSLILLLAIIYILGFLFKDMEKSSSNFFNDNNSLVPLLVSVNRTFTLCIGLAAIDNTIMSASLPIIKWLCSKFRKPFTIISLHILISPSSGSHDFENVISGLTNLYLVINA